MAACDTIAHGAGVRPPRQPAIVGWVDLAAALDQGAQNADRIGTHRLQDGHELDHVEPTLSAFVLGDERLWLANALGELLLGEASVSTCCDQQLAQGELFGRVDRLEVESTPRQRDGWQTSMRRRSVSRDGTLFVANL